MQLRSDFFWEQASEAIKLAKKDFLKDYCKLRVSKKVTKDQRDALIFNAAISLEHWLDLIQSAKENINDVLSDQPENTQLKENSKAWLNFLGNQEVETDAFISDPILKNDTKNKEPLVYGQKNLYSLFSCCLGRSRKEESKPAETPYHRLTNMPDAESLQ